MATQKALKLREDAHRKKLEDGILEILASQKEVLAGQEELLATVDELVGLIQKDHKASKKSGGTK